MNIKQIYFKSDFTVILASEVQWGGCPFRLSFYTASPSRSFVASFDGEKWENCRLLDDGRLEIAINQKDGCIRTLMGIGTLHVAPEFYLDNDAFRDHVCNQFIKPFVPIFNDNGISAHVDGRTIILQNVIMNNILNGAPGEIRFDLMYYGQETNGWYLVKRGDDLVMNGPSAQTLTCEPQSFSYDEMLDVIKLTIPEVPQIGECTDVYIESSKRSIVDNPVTESYELALTLDGASTLTTIGTLPAFYQKGLTQEEHDALIAATGHAEGAARDAETSTENANEAARKADEARVAIINIYNEKLAALNADYAAKKQALDNDYASVKNALGQDYTQAKEAIASEYAAKQTALANEYKAKQDALAAAYSRDLKALNDRMAAIESQYATDKAAWQKQVDDFIAQCSASFAQDEQNRSQTFTTNEAARQKAASDQRNEEDATFQQKEAERDAAVAEATKVAQQVAQNTEKLIDLENKVSQNTDAIKELQSLFGNGVEGYVRVSGVSDPAFNYRSYKHEVGAESVFDCLKPCLVGNNFTGRVGEILHVLNPLNWYETEDGRTVKLDATEGEVMICPTKTMYGISGHVTFGTVTYDVFLRSFVPFEWHGHPAEKIAPVGWSPSYTVAHKDDDNVTRMHSCYNPAFNGSYDAQKGIVGAFVQTQNEDGTISEQYDGTAALFGGAGGLHTTNLALYTGEQYAMNLNEDTTKTYPFMNRTAQCEELMFGNMLAEGGTFDVHNLSLMGSGFCSNDTATSAAHWEDSNADARNGFRYVKQDGTWGYYSIGSNANFGYGATGDNLYKACMLNSWRSPWKCMEQQRVMMYAISNNIPELTWFAFEGNKYKWRHVDGFEGPTNGAMTCVVWKHFSSKLVQGCVEPGTTKDVSGNRCEFLICSALYRGVITDVSPSWWTSGLLFTQDADGTMFAYVQRDQKQLIKSPSTTSRATDAEPWPFENSYVAAGDFTNSNAYCKDYNDAALMLPKNRATQTGAGLHTYVGAYKYLSVTKPSSGFSVRGFRRGLYAVGSNLSPLYVNGNVTPSSTSAYIAFGICCEIESRGL